ncbi:acyl carrier protein [Streptococcus sp. HF-1907]|uniref:acyl carrier protein n=1 Tax=Streptococcus sp. HF-1907 TaxID=2785793 RepID=UPI0018A0EAB7|nr:acyl carrier protein [Streptococcus sp. HF-1907]MBF7095063.1 acyl carrier protein [Streptococcus sp. HF-1907]
MTKEEIFDRIATLIKEQLGKVDLVVTPETSLKDDLGVDSIALTEFVITLEDDFNLEIPDEDVEDMTSMGDMLDYLALRLAK